MGLPNQIEAFSRIAADHRADQGTRMILLASDMIRIDRVLHGMKMAIHVPVAAYRGVMLSVCEGQGDSHYEIKLAHRDPDLSIWLEAANTREAAQALLAQWGAFFGRPTLEEKTRLPKARRRCWTSVAKRRPRRLMRRKQGNGGNLLIVRRDEREIICYE